MLETASDQPSYLHLSEVLAWCDTPESDFLAHEVTLASGMMDVPFEVLELQTEQRKFRSQRMLPIACMID